MSANIPAVVGKGCKRMHILDFLPQPVDWDSFDDPDSFLWLFMQRLRVLYPHKAEELAQEIKLKRESGASKLISRSTQTEPTDYIPEEQSIPVVGGRCPHEKNSKHGRCIPSVSCIQNLGGRPSPPEGYVYKKQDRAQERLLETEGVVICNVTVSQSTQTVAEPQWIMPSYAAQQHAGQAHQNPRLMKIQEVGEMLINENIDSPRVHIPPEGNLGKLFQNISDTYHYSLQVRTNFNLESVVLEFSVTLAAKAWSESLTEELRTTDF